MPAKGRPRFATKENLKNFRDFNLDHIALYAERCVCGSTALLEEGRCRKCRLDAGLLADKPHLESTQLSLPDYLPTPEEIERERDAIKAAWPPETRARRRVQRRRAYTDPVIPSECLTLAGRPIRIA